MQIQTSAKLKASTVSNPAAAIRSTVICRLDDSHLPANQPRQRQTAQEKSRRTVFSLLVGLPLLFCLFLMEPQATSAQANYEHTKDKADQTLRSNARINPLTLAVELAIPIADLPGRGGTSMPLVFNYSSKVWELEATGASYGQNGTQAEVRPLYSQGATGGWTTSYDAPSIDAGVEPYDCNGNAVSGTGSLPFGCVAYYYVKRIRVTLPGGETHELRKDDSTYASMTTMDKTGTYYAVDGTRVRLEWGSQGAATLLMPDGGRFLFDSSLNCTAYSDRSGNTLSYNLTNRSWTDTLGRTLAAPFSSAVAQTERTQSFTMPGIGASSRTFQIVWKKLSSGALLSGETMKYVTELCGSGSSRTPLLFASTTEIRPCDGTSGYFDPIVISEIILPNNLKYKFAYNAYGEIARIDYPTGAYEKFIYDKITALGWDYQTNYARANSYGQANRGVIDRRVGADDVALEQQWLYAAGYQTTATYGADTYVMTTTAPDNTKTKRFLFRAKRPVNTGLGDFGFDTILAGREMETQQLDTNGVIRSRQLFEWETTNGAAVSSGAIPQRDARLKRTVGIVFDPNNTNALATLSTTDYDTTGSSDAAYFSALNPKQTKSYHYVAVGSSTAQTATLATVAGYFSQTQLANTTEIDYLYDANYKARNICGLVTETRFKDASGAIKAKSQIAYDEYTPGATGTPSQWTDPGTNYRGYVTTTRSWTDIANNQSVETHAHYDKLGNVISATDARGFTTTTDYSSTYAYAYPTSVTTPAPDTNGGANGSTTGLTTSSAYDYNTGLPTSVTDANGQVTQMDYSDSTSSTGYDPLLRIRKVTAPNGQQTITEYGAGTNSSTRYVKVSSQIDATNWKIGYSRYDGLGRAIKSQAVDSSGDVFSDTEYDNMGRVKRVTNPYRSGGSIYWTENTYDDLDRVTKVKTLGDNAEVNTAYSLGTGTTVGTVVTVTDQASKQRRSVTDALGQLSRVDEPDTSGSLGTIDSPAQPTVYTYDTLSNLWTVTQAGLNQAQCGVGTNSCTQTRTFNYDALSRLKQAVNPESGTINYTYDNNGNLTTRMDARLITTTYAYDNLNRVKSRTYNDGVTPAVAYYYDNLTNAKGRLIKVASSVSTTEYTGFDTMGRVTAHQQTTDGVTYTTGYSYNLSGSMLTETYPSTRVVQNVLDADGDLALVQSKKTSAAGFWNYAKSFTYTAAGAVSSMQLGNGKWESTAFNTRLQPTQIALGTVQNGTDNLKLNFSYNTSSSTTDNNGNVTSQTITVPAIGTNAAFTATQNYTYDSLNRLKQATETIPGQTGWQQTFTYDRFGNRNFDEANTTTLTKNCSGGTTVCAGDVPVYDPMVSATTNRLNGYSYDNAGNTTANAISQTFTYDAENKQTKVQSGSTILGEYSYDGDGKRVKKNVPATGETTIFVYDVSGKMIAEYSTIVAASSVAKVSYLTNDHLGSPRITTDANGGVTSRRDFMPFGEEITRSSYGADTVRQKFTSYERDNESELDFAQARMFGSSLGRFTSPDPLMASAKRTNPQTWNRYTYVLSNPLKYTDPSGMIWGQKDLGGGTTSYCYAEGKALCKGYTKYTGDGILDNATVNGQQVGAIRLLAGGGIERVVAINIPGGGGRSWLSAKDAEAINDATGGALCSLSGGLACPNAGSKIADNVKVAADVVQLAFLVKSLLKAGLTLGAIAAVLKRDPEEIANAAKSIGELNAVWKPQKALIDIAFGVAPGKTATGAEAAQQVLNGLRNGNVPEGLEGITKESLRAYREIAERTIARGADKGTQVLRVEIIDELLKHNELFH